jgi:polo-like kinase 4
MMIYQPHNPVILNMSGQPLYMEPQRTPHNAIIKQYMYADLPVKYWKKYQYAADVVDLMRSKTPKITMYAKRAKCMLMENSDFEVTFYDGTLSVK